MSVIIGSMRHEVNSFCRKTVDLEEFRHGYLLYGEEIEKELTGKREGESAFLDVLRENNMQAACTVAAKDASAGGPVTAEAFAHLMQEFKQRTAQIAETEGVDAVLLNLHGAMLTEDSDDPEGELVEMIRKIVGEKPPIGVSLDAHAKITKRLVENADIIVGYHTIPHIDAYETSYRVAELVMGMLKGEVHPYMASITIPTLLPVEAENHNFGFYQGMVEKSREYESREGVYSVTCFPGQPWLDYPGNAGSFVTAISDSREKSETIVREMASLFWERKETCITDKYPIETAVQKGLQEEGPVVLAELGDAPPAGSTGDGNDLLRALLKAEPKAPCLVTVVDPEAVRDAERAGEGNTVRTTVGWKLDQRWGSPIEIQGEVLKVQRGDFIMAMGDTRGTMGLSAVIRIGEIYLIVCEYTFSHYDPNSYRCMGLEPEKAQLVGVKSTEHFRAFYGKLAKDILLADTEGPSMSSFTKFDWKKKGHPIWPLDHFEWCAEEQEVYKSRREGR